MILYIVIDYSIEYELDFSISARRIFSISMVIV